MDMMNEKNRPAYILVRYIWPLLLMFRLVVYGFFDSPTHLGFWHTSRLGHCSFYIAAAVLVAITLKKVPRKLLIIKTGVLTGVSLISFVGDLYIDPHASQRWGATDWFIIMFANIIAILLRLIWSKETLDA